MKLILAVETGWPRLDAFLARQLKGYTRSFLKDIIGRGLVSVNGEPRDPDELVAEGDRIVVELPQSEAGEGKDFESWVLFEDKRLIVLSKPAGLLMHPLGTSWLTTPEAARSEPGVNLAGILQIFRPAILKAVANRRRLAILAHLKKNRQATVGDIADAIRLSLKATSKHLAILKTSDIVENEQRIALVFYRLASDQRAYIKSLLSHL